jgi:hypothetical protein
MADTAKAVINLAARLEDAERAARRSPGSSSSTPTAAEACSPLPPASAPASWTRVSSSRTGSSAARHPSGSDWW